MQPLAVPAGYVLLTLVLFTPAPARAQSPAAAAVPPTALASVTDAPPFDQAMALAELRKAIVGKEDLPSVEVFKNITQYKGVTAGRLLRIMDYGFTRSLGVELHALSCARPVGSRRQGAQADCAGHEPDDGGDQQRPPEEDVRPEQRESVGELHDLPPGAEAARPRVAAGPRHLACSTSLTESTCCSPESPARARPA